MNLVVLAAGDHLVHFLHALADLGEFVEGAGASVEPVATAEAVGDHVVAPAAAGGSGTDPVPAHLTAASSFSGSLRWLAWLVSWLPSFSCLLPRLSVAGVVHCTVGSSISWSTARRLLGNLSFLSWRMTAAAVALVTPSSSWICRAVLSLGSSARISNLPADGGRPPAPVKSWVVVLLVGLIGGCCG
ncbi:MAG: hypothetical protein OXG37_13060, partial [Actinomycetia bacterium]|nr:hypothetical protein [Actinomycetes bacterium]